MSQIVRTVSTVGFVALLAMCVSCERKEAEQVELNDLPYLRHTHHQELKAELARLEAELATPRLLDESTHGANGATLAEYATQLGEELNGIYPAQNVRLTLERIELFYPEDKFQFDPVKLEKARKVQTKCAPQLEQYRELFYREQFQFAVSMSDGLLADLSVLDHAILAHRLESLVAADVLSGGQSSAALLALRNMALIETRLAVVPNVAARSTAASLRAELFRVVEALVEHPQFSSVELDELLAIIEAQLADWTPDQVAWVGDRALGLHAYEMVRDGQLMSVLTTKEIKTLEHQGDLDAFNKAVRKSLDDDQWFYLSTMRRVIDACDDPFFKRLPLFEKINTDVEALWDTPRCPLFAANVLLPNVAAVQRELAIDRARCEAWVIALSAAAGKPVDTSGLNPVTGEPYDLEREIDSIVVRNLAGELDNDPAVTVPVLQE